MVDTFNNNWSVTTGNTDNIFKFTSVQASIFGRYSSHIPLDSRIKCWLRIRAWYDATIMKEPRFRRWWGKTTANDEKSCFFFKWTFYGEALNHRFNWNKNRSKKTYLVLLKKNKQSTQTVKKLGWGRFVLFRCHGIGPFFVRYFGISRKNVRYYGISSPAGDGKLLHNLLVF